MSLMTKICLLINHGFLWTVVEMNEVNKIKMFISKQFINYFAKIISEIIEVRHGKLFVKTNIIVFSVLHIYINQVINQSINQSLLSKVCQIYWVDIFDKIDAEWWNSSHKHYCYITVQSSWLYGDKSLVSKSLCDWCLILHKQNHYGYDTSLVHVDKVMEHVRLGEGFFAVFAGGNQRYTLIRDLSVVVCWSLHTSHCMLKRTH